jgi:phage tail sheath gpL-like
MKRSRAGRITGLLIVAATTAACTVPQRDTNITSTSASPIAASEAPPASSPTMSRDQIEQFKSRVDAALDEINPAKDTLVAALRTHDVAAVHIGCRPVGQAGRDLSAALAEGRGYALPERVAALVTQMQRAADELQQAERDCLPLWPGSTEAEFDRVVSDMSQVAQNIDNPP